MSARRPLGEMLQEIGGGALLAAAAPGITLRSLHVVLPIEVALTRARGEWSLLGDVPRTVTRTAFDVEPGRLEVLWTSEEGA